MIVVDTSVWIEALRDGGSAEAQGLRALLDADAVALAVPVRIEILSGAGRRDRVSLRRALSGLPVLVPGDATWSRIDAWIDIAADRGERFGFADLLIASLAADRADEIWSLDDDFRRMAKLGFVRLHDPTDRKAG